MFFPDFFSKGIQKIFRGRKSHIGNEKSRFEFFKQFFIDFRSTKNIQIGGSFGEPCLETSQPGLLFFFFRLGNGLGSLYIDSIRCNDSEIADVSCVSSDKTGLLISSFVLATSVFFLKKLNIGNHLNKLKLEAKF